jgi:hypothetical protein
LAGCLLGRQGVGKPAIGKNRATPAEAGADANLAAGPCGGAPGQPAAHCGQSGQNRETQAIPQKFAAAGAGIWRASVHNSAISINIRQVAATGLPSFAQPLPFLALLSAWLI